MVGSAEGIVAIGEETDGGEASGVGIAEPDVIDLLTCATAQVLVSP